MTEPAAAESPSTPFPLTRVQRRVLGTLMEKGLTTPEYYPLTLKAVTTGCNQKNNRDPVVTYDEDTVEQTLDELRELGLAAVVHTESGRSARYRHYMRHKFGISEPQMAILTELLLRGRQSLGELRGRASRMVPIETLDQLRAELSGLMDRKFAAADGSLDRRGALVDHDLYPPNDRQPWGPRVETEPVETEREPVPRAAAASPTAAPANRIAELEEECRKLAAGQGELREALGALQGQMEELTESFESLRRSLGG